VFDYARQRACVLFLDEFDTVGKERGDTHETGEIKRVVSTLLLQMDQLPAHVVVVTATNHAELLDRAVWRRFELRLTIAPPTKKQIVEFLSKLFDGFELFRDVSPAPMASHLVGSTYSEIEDLFRNVARAAVLAGPDARANEIARRCLAAWKRRAGSRTRRRG
jgi:SpoVK/Ycf46/Vps4 family AAA+-type ATPase